jgi:hypothetical protein
MIASWLIFDMNLADWVLFFLATGIIFGILGKRLLSDMDAWRAGRASARPVDGHES